MTRLRVPVTPADHAEGAPNAPVTLVEYGDYECPHCGRAFPIIKRVQRAMGTRLRFVFRNFPIAESHPHARRAAAAAEAAGRQGHFWPMHDLLYRNQHHLDDASLERYTAEVGLNMAAFASDLDDQDVAARVEADFEGGVRSGVNGTPTFFVNGVRLDSSWDYDSLLQVLESAPGVKTP